MVEMLGRAGEGQADRAVAIQGDPGADSPEHLDHPRTLAERLPKALIHHNVPPEPIAAFLADLGKAWESAASLAVFSPRQRWSAAAEAVRERWPILSSARRHRQGEITVSWAAVSPP